MVNNSKLGAYGFDGSDEFLGRFRNFIGLFTAACKGSAGTDDDAAEPYPFTGVIDVNAARRHERCLRQGEVDGFDGLHGYYGFNSVSTAFKGRNGVF